MKTNLEGDSLSYMNCAGLSSTLNSSTLISGPITQEGHNFFSGQQGITNIFFCLHTPCHALIYATMTKPGA